jgi:hypothetical protein
MEKGKAEKDPSKNFEKELAESYSKLEKYSKSVEDQFDCPDCTKRQEPTS